MIDKKYLPSKKFVTALSVAVVIICIVVVISYWKPRTTSFLNSNLSATNTSAVVNIDSDNDGLPDWKENLYGTDPKKADTDTDGTSDFDEIALNRDPLKANTAPKGQEANDKIDLAIIEENKKAMEEYEKLNEIDKFSRNLMSNIIASQPVNGSMSTDTINEIVSKSVAEMPEKSYVGITKSTDLNLQTTDNTNLSKNMTAYSKNFFTATQKIIPVFGAELEIISLYVSGTSKIVKPAMAQVTDVYQEVVNELIKMPVPVAIGYYDVSYHLKIINDLEMMIAIDNNIVNSDKESLSIFSNLSKYKDITSNLLSTLTTVDNILKIQR